MYPQEWRRLAQGDTAIPPQSYSTIYYNYQSFTLQTIGFAVVCTAARFGVRKQIPGKYSLQDSTQALLFAGGGL